MDPWQETQLLGQADAVHRRGDLGESMRILTSVVEANPSNAEARRALAIVMSMVGDRGEAVEHMRQALASRPLDPVWQFEMGHVLESAGRLEEASESFGRAEELDPKDARYPARLAMLARRLRDDDGTRAAAERALRLDPNQPAALLALAQDCIGRGLLEEGEALARRLIDGARNPQDRASGLLELGRIQERLGQFGESFESHMSANKIKLATPVAHSAIRSKVLMHFPGYLGQGDAPERYRAWGAEGHGDAIPPPVVLTGFLRSGTTMAEQILGSHPGVATSEERPLCIAVRRELGAMVDEGARQRPVLEVLDGLSEEQVLRLRAVYREHLEGAVPEDLRDRVLVDKHPLRTLDLGMMNRIFPETRVIFMIRDPRDVCLSAMFQGFGVNPATVRFLSPPLCAKWYEAVMGFWLKLRPMLSIDVLEVRYEDLVTDFDSWAPRMLEFAGVGWDEAVRSFYEPAGRRVIRSASFEAVTERLNTRAIGRWKRYAGKLAPILDRLEPFVEALGYEPTPANPGAASS